MKCRQTENAAYYNPQCKIKVKPDGIQYRVRGTIGGDQVHYPGVTATYVAHLDTIRILLNAAGVHAHQLEAHSTRHTTTLQHSLHGTQCYILMEISKGIYGLPQAGKLSQDQLVQHLATHE